MKLWLIAAVAGLSGLLLGIGSSGSSKTSAADDKIVPGTASAPLALATDNPIGRNLDASLYMQTSAEYRAACYQAYRLASLRLNEYLAAPKNPLDPAVVMDLDETVLDNGGFQAMMIRVNREVQREQRSIDEKPNRKKLQEPSERQARRQRPVRARA